MSYDRVAVLKPPVTHVRSVLKIMKDRFDEPAVTGRQVPGLIRAAYLANDRRVEAWSGEMLHRVAEWTDRHGDPGRAHDFYEDALAMFHESETLGPARCYRDFAKLFARRRRFDESFNALSQADQLHLRDRSLAEHAPLPRFEKAVRQHRVTSIRLLQARVHADADRSEAIEELIDQAIYEREFCLRDQHDLVSFILPYSGGSDRRALHVRLVQINSLRGRPIGTIRSMAQVVIDKELELAGQLARPITQRKEWFLPRQ